MCFAIAIEKSQRIRPGIMVGASSLLAGVTYHLQESDAELLVRLLLFSNTCIHKFIYTFFIPPPGSTPALLKKSQQN